MSPDDAALEQLCMFGTQEDHCGAPAKFHVLFDIGDGPVRSMECHKHVQWWLTRHKVQKFDWHGIGHVCGIPDAVWNFSTVIAKGDGSCSIDWGDSLDALAESKELVSV
jgi:hypothetical protein